MYNPEAQQEGRFFAITKPGTVTASRRCCATCPPSHGREGDVHLAAPPPPPPLVQLVRCSRRCLPPQVSTEWVILLRDRGTTVSQFMFSRVEEAPQADHHHSLRPPPPSPLHRPARLTDTLNRSVKVPLFPTELPKRGQHFDGV